MSELLIGMMWFDTDPLMTVEQKLYKAASHYQKKYGARPNRAYVDPGMLAEEATIAGMLVTPKRDVLRNNIWIGVTND